MEEFVPTPTYRTEMVGDQCIYHCLYCVHWASDKDLFTLHMQQRHDGTMIEAPAEVSDAPEKSAAWNAPAPVREGA